MSHSLVVRVLVRSKPTEAAWYAPSHTIQGEWTLHDVVDAIRERYQVQQVLGFTFLDPMTCGWADPLFDVHPVPRNVAVREESLSSTPVRDLLKDEIDRFRPS